MRAILERLTCSHDADTDPRYCDECAEQARAEAEDEFWFWTGGCIEPSEPPDVLAQQAS
jgi:hypothetical protein